MSKKETFLLMQFASYVASQAEALRKVAVERAARVEDKAELTQKERAWYERLKSKQVDRMRNQKKLQRRKQSKKKKH